MSGSIGTSNISFSAIVNAYNNVNTTDLPTTNISLSSFRNKTFDDSTSVPSSGAISINSHFKGKTWGSPSLYTFSTHTFTNCGKTGASGPTLSECRSSYSPSWTDNTSYFNVTQTGYQIWTVPETASYTIDAYGARGGYNYTSNNDGGYGARMRGTFSLSEGDKYMILVGQMGGREPTNDTSDGSGGGGGTFIVKGTSYSGRSISDVLIVAGGGGGAGRTSGDPGSGGLANPDNTSTAAGSPGTYSSGGGGSLLTNSTGTGYYGASVSPTYGYAFINGGTGGGAGGYSTGNPLTSGDKQGGFGCGGGSSVHTGGGGGGYSGGNGGILDANPNAGGGGSHNNGTSQINSAAYWTSNGKIIITKV